ncbi:hypothetical protein FRC06_001673 [Ceratobasidium sp. 370]|nr:hypothetical protein FRC06_001673 [Ceratobasidium sp. 370]
MSSTELPAKRALKPSAAEKRCNEWKDEVNEEKAQKKRAKITKVEEANRRTANLNWDFADLQDVEEEKFYRGGRRPYAIVDELIIKCKSSKTGDTRYRYSSDGCRQSWASRQPQRHLAHAIKVWQFMNTELRERASEASDVLAPGSKVMKLESAKVNQRAGKPAEARSEPSVASLVTLEVRKAKLARFDFAILNSVAAAQLPPFKLELPEFHALIVEANPNLHPKSSGYVVSCQIPMESARPRRISVQELKKCTNLKLSFDGGSTIRPQSFTTIHVTAPDARIPDLMEAPEASGVSHTGEFYAKLLERLYESLSIMTRPVLRCPTIIVLPDPGHTIHNVVKDIYRLEYFAEARSNMQTIWGYFSRSSYSTTHLAGARQQRGITCTVQKPRKTRFGGCHDASNSAEENLPAVEDFVNSGIIDIKRDHKLYFIQNLITYSKFKLETHQLIQVTRLFARSIKCLESGHSNLGDVFSFTLGLMASLRQIADKKDTELGLPDSVVKILRMGCIKLFRLSNHSLPHMLMPTASRVFSVVPKSMAEEHTVSCLSKLNSTDQVRKKVSTLVHMTRIRQDLIRKRASNQPAVRPVLRFRDLSNTLLKQTTPSSSSSARPPIPPAPVDLANEWLPEDAE